MYIVCKRVFRIIALSAAFIMLYYCVLSRWFSFEALRGYSCWFSDNMVEQYLATVIIFTTIFSALVASALPIVAPLGLMSGYLFGTLEGALYSLISCTIGGTISFLWMRKYFGAKLRERYAQRFSRVQRQIFTYGPVYFLLLHYSIVLPLSVINALAVITNASLPTVVWTTIFGCFPMVLVYSFAGRQLSTMSTMKDVFSGSTIIIFLLLAIAVYLLSRFAHHLHRDDQ